jgi:hypothetical protein
MPHSPFTDRLLGHSRIAHTDPNGSAPIVFAVKDQVIVKATALTDFKNALGTFPKGQKPVAPSVVFNTPIFDTALPTGADQYVVAEVQDNSEDIFHLVDFVRTSRLFTRDNVPSDVSPNHVLIPAPFNGGCPYGPPAPAPDISVSVPPATDHHAVVTVIDSSYQDWWDKHVHTKLGNFGPWGDNPIWDLLGTPKQDHDQQPMIHHADWINGSKTKLTPANVMNLAGSVQAVQGWNTATLGDVPETRKRGLVDAMAGHANFVAGVIAQGCDQPYIDVWSHNGSYTQDADFFPTEASVCRSIAKSQKGKPADVIHVGFAFPLREPGFTYFHVERDFLSGIWRTTMQAVQRPGGRTPALVAPVGNEASSSPYFPAALATWAKTNDTKNVHLYDLVIGVGSLDQLAGHPGPGGVMIWSHEGSKAFTNNGSWVTCAAVGQHVQSTFMPVGDVQCEDDLTSPKKQRQFTDAWATWSGTSFAAPKVSAAIAARVSATSTPADAWNQLKAVTGHSASTDGLDLGSYRFTNL